MVNSSLDFTMDQVIPKWLNTILMILMYSSSEMYTFSEI